MITIEADGLDTFDSDTLYRIEGVKKVSAGAGTLKLAVIPGIENLDRIIAVLIEHGKRINSITTAISLETVFLNLTGRSLRD